MGKLNYRIEQTATLIGLGIASLVLVGTGIQQETRSAVAHTAPATSQLIQPETVASLQPKAVFQVAQRNNTCRRIVANRVNFTSSPGSSQSFGQVLYRDDRVTLLDNGRTVRGDDGQLYLRVSYPYGGSSASSGYIPTQVEDANGTFRSPLGRCGYPARW